MKIDPISRRPLRGSHDRERAILLGLEASGDRPSYGEPLEELARLADTAGAKVVDRMVQRRAHPDARTYVGKGKAVEVGERLKDLGADLVIVDHGLSPGQARNLEKSIGGRVIDRTELILDIFALRARTAMARMQVELAQMEYSLPRLKRLWTHLGREVSGKAGIGSRGPGEKQIETDRRLVRRRIGALKESLADLQEHRVRLTRQRDRHFSACLVGYTNAGKSTLLKALTGADVFIEDRLFATLDTTTRAWDLAPGHRVFLSDTVGFIRDLPHHLVGSFLATLEEARFADLLIHVIDASDPAASEHVDVVEQTLSDIGAGGVPRIAALNQVDRVRDPVALRLLEERLPGSVRISALDGTGLEELRAAVLASAAKRDLDVVVEADPGNGRLLARLREWGDVREVTYPDGRARVTMRVPSQHVEKIRRAGGVILEGAPPAPSEDD